ncbi:MAG: hypothetical protein Q4A81_00805 [Pasteurellaceae bacterium]|nr:hypothetical protein [Pasteurellaceae bacterium]
MLKNIKSYNDLFKLISVTVLSLGLTMISSFALAHLLSVDDRGLHQLFVTSISYVGSISTGGVGFAIALCMRNNQYKNWKTYFLVFLGFSVLVAVIALYLFTFTAFHLLFILNVVLTALLTMTLEKCKIDSKLKVYRALTLQQPIILVSVYGITYLLLGEQPLWVSINLLTLYAILQAIACVVYLKRIEMEYKNDNKNYTKISPRFFFTTWSKQNILQIFSATTASLDKYLIVFFLGKYTLGLYTVCIAFDSLVTRFIYILADYYYSGLLNNLNRLKSVLFVIFLMSVGAILLVPILATPVITFFFSAKYIDVAPVLIFFIINSIISGLSWVLSQNMLLLGKQVLLFTRQVIAILVFVILFYFLQRYQLHGLAYSYIGASLTRLVISIIYYFKYPVTNLVVSKSN